MTKLKQEKWTLVQHSGYGYGEKEGFRRGVEIRSLSTVGEVRIVQKAGGVVFDSYDDAMEAEESENYPPGTVGMYPNAQGQFSDKIIDDLRIYIPKRNAVK